MFFRHVFMPLHWPSSSTLRARTTHWLSLLRACIRFRQGVRGFDKKSDVSDGNYDSKPACAQYFRVERPARAYSTLDSVGGFILGWLPVMKVHALRLVLSLFGLLVARPALADSFSFSYVFSSVDLTLSGTFNGTQNGQFVEDVTDFALFVDGTPLAVPFSGHLNESTFEWAPVPVISFNLLLNNFAFADANFVAGETGDTNFHVVPFLGVFFTNTHLGAGYDAGHEGTWVLKNLSTSPVPDHGLTAGMLLLALAGLRLLRRSTAA